MERVNPLSRDKIDKGNLGRTGGHEAFGSGKKRRLEPDLR